MKTTIPACLYNLTEEDKLDIMKEMNKYSFMIRYAYKRLQEKMDKGSLEKLLSSKTDMTIRFAKDAVEEGRQLIDSRKELMKEYLSLWTSRYEKTLSRYEKLLAIPTLYKFSKRHLGLENAIEKQKRMIEHYSNHIKNGTFDEVIFGGRKNFEKRSKNQLSKEEWWECRNGRISSRGDASKGGNPNLKVIEKEGSFFLEMTTSSKYVKGKRTFYHKKLFHLYVATKRSKNTGLLNGRKYPELLKKVLASGEAYQVEILKRNGKFHVHITVTEKPSTLVTHPINGYKAIDTNPDGLAICHLKKDGNPLSFKWIGDGGLQDYPSEKRENLIGELCHKVIKECLTDGTGLIVEDLKFVQDKQVSRKFRRMSHSFCYKKILTTLERLCERYGVELIKVKPAYTSIIGRLKYQQRYRISVHQSAALVIGRRGLGLKERVPKKLSSLLTKKQKETLLSKTEWGRWEVIRTRITNLLRKRNAKFYQWFDYKKEIFAK